GNRHPHFSLVTSPISLGRRSRCSGNIAYRCSKPPGTDRMSPKHQRFWILMSVLVCRVYIYLTVCVCVRLVCRFERLEVLAVFASTVLVQLGALFILKESVERFMEQPEVHTGRLLVGTFVALFFNLLTLLSVRNKPFAYVSEESQHLADVLCGIVPGLSSVLLPRMNPFVLINMAGALSLCITYMLIEINNFNAVDTASAVAIALMTFGTMYPMSVYSGKVLLQTTPSHIIGQLDKLLREVRAGAGSAHVRIRRDANEQLVLAHVTNRLLPLVSTLTVQIFKDDWSRPLLTGALSSSSSSSPAASPLGAADGYAALASSLPPLLLSSGGEFDPLTSTPSKPTSPPPEFSFDTPGRNVQPMVLAALGHHTHRPYGGLGLSYGSTPYTGMLNQGLARISAAPLLSGSNLTPPRSTLPAPRSAQVTPADCVRAN
uniref:Solute carrier family 30 member 6 n=1 Tax=Neolamprologus brichardi TaxID=32507 RepID=A0A3Q4GQB2_NEOBR